jgi:glutathione peroxidase
MMNDQIPGCLVAAGMLLASIGCGEGQNQSSTGPEPAQTVVPTTATSGGVIIDHTVVSLTGETVDLTSFRGRPLLIVNTASKCGYTPQYAGLQELYERYGEGDLVVLGFPSNDFGNQEPGTAEEIGNFCRLNYGVTFPMMAKVHTKGPNQAPLYKTLTSESAEEFQGEIRWNFTKFLIDQDGRIVERFESGVDPLDDQVISTIDALLADRNQQG